MLSLFDGKWTFLFVFCLMKIMKRVIKMPPNLSALLTVGDETLEPPV